MADMCVETGGIFKVCFVCGKAINQYENEAPKDRLYLF